VDKIDGSAWGENTPENMAPPLRQFFNRKDSIVTRISSWFKKWQNPVPTYEGKTLHQWSNDLRKSSNLVDPQLSVLSPFRVLNRFLSDPALSRPCFTPAEEASGFTDPAAMRAYGEPVEKLCSMGTASVSALTKITRDSCPLMRATSLAILARIGPEARPAIPAIVKAMEKDRVFTVRLCATKALGLIGCASAIPALQQVLKDDHVGGAAADAIERIRNTNEQRLPRDSKAIPSGRTGEEQKGVLLRFSCPGCGKKLTAHPAARGKKVKCTKCGQTLTIPPVKKTGEILPKIVRMLQEVPQAHEPFMLTCECGLRLPVSTPDSIEPGKCPKCGAAWSETTQLVFCPFCSTQNPYFSRVFANGSPTFCKP